MSSLSVKRLIIDSPGCSLPNLVYSLLSLFVTQSEAYTNIGVAPESACTKNTSVLETCTFRLWIATGFTAFSGLEYFCLHVIFAYFS